jgi:8-oxo-dGTP pyrophosphatase MutT (NUDIX family)
MRYRRDISAGVIVFHRAASGCTFLLVLSRLTKNPLWEFPKGGVDQGESRQDAALRELLEETGLAPEDVRVVPGFERKEVYRFSAGQGDERILVHKEVTYFLAESTHTDVRISITELSEFAWLDLAEARKRIRYAARRAILEAAAEAAGCSPPTLQSETSSRKREARRSSGRDRA